MPKIKPIVDSLREALKDLVTADNTDAVAKVTKQIDSLEEQSNTLETENLTLKDKIVDMVKGTLTTKDKPENEVDKEKELTLDEASDKALEKALEFDAKNKK